MTVSQRSRDGGVWANLLAPLRLPERASAALGDLAGAARELHAIRSELTRVREQTAPLAGMGTALERINEDLATRLDALHDVLAPVDEHLATIERTVGGLAGEMGAPHESLHDVQQDIQRMSGLPGVSVGWPSAPASVSSGARTDMNVARGYTEPKERSMHVDQPPRHG